MPVVADFGRVDVAVIALYLAGIVLTGLWVSRQPGGAERYFLASRESTWPVVGLSLLASNISSTTLVGLAGAAYVIGISVYNYEWMAGVVLVLFSVFVLPIILRNQVYTMPEYLGRRYDSATRSYFAVLTLFLNIVVDTAGTLYGGSLIFKLVYPQAPLVWIVAAIAVAAGIYTIAGGLRAVILTEVVQAVVLLAAAGAIAWFAFDRAGGWEQVMTRVPAEKLSLIRPLDDPGVPWPGLVLGVPILGFYFWCTNQFMVQRVLSARSVDHGRWGSLFAGLLKLPVLYLMVLPGTAAILLYPDLANGDLVYPTLVFDLLPAGVVGLVVAGFLAAIMSSIASTFNSAATLFTMDFVRRWRPDLGGAVLVRTGRLTTLGFMLLAILWAPQIERFGSLWQYLQAILAYAVPPVVVLFVGGVLWPRANASGARWTIATGLVAGTMLFALNAVFGVIDLHFLYVAPLLLALCAAALVVGSRRAAAPDAAAVATLLWRPQLWRDESAALAGVPAWRNYRVQSVVLLALTAAVVAAFG
jgi:SSS family solute:Na+ symporter